MLNFIIDFLNNTGKVVWTSIICFVTGSSAKIVSEDIPLPIFDQVLRMMQFMSYFVGIIVGIFAIITWCKKNKQK
jgi:hypothetical protein